ncbi:hypothetical protein [Dyadobacter crusticola]|uniref:hypothetical protein n=1 Tax=Dyadobacter crusticola TaxID=292407 RepID=UPI0004E1435D|nr:hypothetical protein [Dyadobacter crusticola]
MEQQPATSQPDQFPTLTYSSEGRGGYVYYLEENLKIAFEWEMAGGDAVAIIYIPVAQYWEVRTNTPLSRRQEIIDFVAARALVQQAKGGRFEIDEDSITLFRS